MVILLLVEVILVSVVCIMCFDLVFRVLVVLFRRMIFGF